MIGVANNFGTCWEGEPAGIQGDHGVVSFNDNKIIIMGVGG